MVSLRAKTVGHCLRFPADGCGAIWNDGPSTDIHKETTMADASQPPYCILRRKQVEARTGLSRSTIYARIKAGTFPAPVSLGPRAVGWIENDVHRWLSDRIEAGWNRATLDGKATASGR
jgi:prophage regulatory protein